MSADGDREVETLGVRIYARIGNSEVMNHLGEAVVLADVEPITDESRRPGDAPDAVTRIIGIDMPMILRRIADDIEARS